MTTNERIADGNLFNSDGYKKELSERMIKGPLTTVGRSHHCSMLFLHRSILLNLTEVACIRFTSLKKISNNLENRSEDLNKAGETPIYKS